MKKTLIPVLLLVAFLLAACGGAKTAEPTPAPTAAPTAAAATEGATTMTSDANPCMPFNILSSKLVEPYTGLPEVTDKDYIIGNKDAKITFMVYSEPQCPYCAQFDPLIDSFLSLYPNDARFVFRLRPFNETFHDKSIMSSQAMVAAGLQGKFNEFRTWIYQHQSKALKDPAVADLADTEFWSGLAPDQFDGWLEQRVGALGLDVNQFMKDMYSDAVVKQVKDAMDSADAIGVNGTPTLFINGYKWPENQRGREIFSIYTELLLNQEKEFNACPAMAVDTAKTYSATISTTQGDIVVDLYADKAPYAVNSFVYLARQGWYNNLPIISSSEFVLSGDPTDTGYGGPGYIYKDEISSDLNFSEPGMLAVFGFGPGMNGGTFFINKTALTGQEGRTIFGKVASGLDVVEKMAIRDNIFTPAVDSILSVTITEK